MRAWPRVVGLLVLGAGSARAESPAEAEARANFVEAQKLFDVARYGEALAAFEKSYELSRYPALIYKIALCQDQLGRVADAIGSYTKYLDAAPDSPRKAGIETRLRTLRALPPAIAPPTPAPPPAPDRAPDSTMILPVTPALMIVARPAVPAVTVERQRPTPLYRRWWLWTTVGVAAAGLAVGLGVGLTAGRFSANFPEQGPGAH